MSQFYYAEVRTRAFERVFALNKSLSKALATSEWTVWGSSLVVLLLAVWLSWKAVPTNTLPEKVRVCVFACATLCVWACIRVSVSLCMRVLCVRVWVVVCVGLTAWCACACLPVWDYQ